MFEINLTHTVNQMVELTLEHGDCKHALVVPIRFLVNDKPSRYAYFFFFRESHCTTVGSIVTSEFPLWYFVSHLPTEWKLEAHHESCSCSDSVGSVLSGIYHSIRREVSPPTAPKTLKIEVRFYKTPRKVPVEKVTRSENTIHVSYKS